MRRGEVSPRWKTSGTGGTSRARKPLPSKSKKTKSQEADRRRVRVEVLERDGYWCQVDGKIPGVRCGRVPGRADLEVHEVVPRGRRPGGHLDPDNCVALCPVHHEWITGNPAEATALGFLAPGP